MMHKRYLNPNTLHAATPRHGILCFLGLDNIFSTVFGLSWPLSLAKLNGQTTLKTKLGMLNQQPQQGFTLLEMLIVIGLLGVLMLSATTYLVDTADLEDEKRQDETKLRWTQIQQATIGNKNQYLNQSPVINSFVADMGRLPLSLRELVDRVYDHDNSALTADKAQPTWQAYPLGANVVGNLWGGWRGPYLNRVGSQTFRDGWQNQNALDAFDDTLNYGWAVTFTVPLEAISVISHGRDNAVGGSGLNEDYPNVAMPLVSANEWQITAASIGFEVVLNRAPAADMAGLELRLFFIEDGVLEEELSEDFTHLASVAGVTQHPVNVLPIAPATTVALPMGKYAAVVWCSASAPEVVYDGDCDPANQTSAVPLTTLPAYYFMLLPNSPLPITIHWNIP